LGARESTVTRYRLRFLLQEIDLPQGDTLIGRSATCHVSIEDPLVSRQHVRVRIQGDRATVEDLGSRNGLQINGRAVQGVHQLRDGDRLRIGTQEVVFCEGTVPSQRARGPGTRPTAFMTHCADCDLPYPAELLECPSCGCTERSDDDTLSQVGDGSQRNWTLQLLVEVLVKAQSLGRSEDVERVLRRARANIEECLTLSRSLDRELVDSVADSAVWLSAQQRDVEWTAWALEVHTALSRVPSRAVIERLSRLDSAGRTALRPALLALVAAVRSSSGPTPEERPAFERLASLTRASGASG
jgi:hypothetical protein